MAGHETTLPVTMDDMLYHTRAVRRAEPRALVVADMPFMSYQASKEDALRNAGRLVKEGFAESVKLEINEDHVETLYAINKAGIPVIGHIGLCPQSVLEMGGYKVQGRGRHEAEQRRRGPGRATLQARGGRGCGVERTGRVSPAMGERAWKTR